MEPAETPSVVGGAHADGESRGICPWCNLPVTTVQRRVKLDAGGYAHEGCVPPLNDVEPDAAAHGAEASEIRITEKTPTFVDQARIEPIETNVPASDLFNEAGHDISSPIPEDSESQGSVGHNVLRRQGFTPESSREVDLNGQTSLLREATFSIGDDDIKTVLRLGYAEGLQTGPFFASCNPYVKVKLLSGGEVCHQSMSSVRWQTLNPIWEEEFELVDMDNQKTVLLEVWCKARFGSDDFMGEVILNPQDYSADPEVAEGKPFNLMLVGNQHKGRDRAKGMLSFCFFCSEENAQGDLWVKPNKELALRHQSIVRPYDPATNTPHSFRSNVLAEGELGEGVALWMKFLWQLAALFFLLFLINFASFLFYIGGDALPSDVRSGQSVFSVTSLGNLFTAEQIAVNLDPSLSSSKITINFFGAEREMDRALLAVLFPILDLVGTLLFALFVFWNARCAAIHAEQRATAAEDGSGHLAVKKYSVMITGIREHALSLTDIRTFMHHAFGEVSVATHSEASLKLSHRRAELLDTIHNIEAQVARTQQEATLQSNQFPLFWVRDPNPKFNHRRTLTCRKAQHLPLVYKLERAEQRLDRLQQQEASAEGADEQGGGEGEQRHGGKDGKLFLAFVTFNEMHVRDTCLRAGARGCCGGGRGAEGGGSASAELNAKFSKAVFSPATDPSDVLWENLEYSTANRAARSVFVGVLVVLLLLASFAGILRAQAYRRDNPVSSCPPSLLSSSRDAVGSAYFFNQRGLASWGPGERGIGIGPLLSTPTDATETAFDTLSTCGGGVYSGRSCTRDDDCPGASCVELDLSCRYQDELDALDLSGQGTSARARVLEEQFVNASGLLWDNIGIAPFCDDGLSVVAVGEMDTMSATARGNATALTDASASALGVDELGQVSNQSCVQLLPPSIPCRVPAECEAYPGCQWGAEEADQCAEVELRGCVVQIRVEDLSGGGVELDWTAAAAGIVNGEAAQGCGGAQKRCWQRLAAEYEVRRAELAAVPVKESTVCGRYQSVCAECFCRDTVGAFWGVWLLKASDAYVAVCSDRFNSILEQITLFAVAVLAVVLVNQALRLLLRLLAGFEKHSTISGKERSIIIKTFLAQTFNTAFVPLLVFARAESLARSECRDSAFDFDPLNPATSFGGNGMECAHGEEQDGRPVCDFAGGVCGSAVPASFPILAGEFTDMTPVWYAAVASTVIITVLVDTLFAFYPLYWELPMQRLQEWLGLRYAATQRQLNRAMEGPDFELSSRYGSLLSVIFVTQLLSAGVPVMHLIAAVTCGLTWVADRYALLKLYKTPPRYDGRFALLAARMLPLAVALHLAFAIWQFSAVLPAVPVSAGIADYLSAAPDTSCREGSEAEKAECQWTCSGNLNVRCGFVVDGVVDINEAACGDWGECRGSKGDALQFDMAARLFTWASFPHFLTLVLLAAAFLVAHSPLWRLLRAFVRREPEAAERPSYSSALRNAAKWQGAFNYDISKLPRYEPAFAYAEAEADGGEGGPSAGLVGPETWMSEEALQALADSLRAKASRSSLVYAMGSPDPLLSSEAHQELTGTSPASHALSPSGSARLPHRRPPRNSGTPSSMASPFGSQAGSFAAGGGSGKWRPSPKGEAAVTRVARRRPSKPLNDGRRQSRGAGVSPAGGIGMPVLGVSPANGMGMQRMTRVEESGAQAEGGGDGQAEGEGEAGVRGEASVSGTISA